MATPEQGLKTQLHNIEKKTGKSLSELSEMIAQCGFSKHGQIRDWLKTELGLGYGDANTLVHFALKSDGASQVAEKGLEGDSILDEIYSGPKGSLRPIHDAVMAVIARFGEEFEVSPKKGYVSLRRKKQFAMMGPATKTAIEIGINQKDLPSNPRLKAMPAGSMCPFTLRVSGVDEVDADLIAWIRSAFEAAG